MKNFVSNIICITMCLTLHGQALSDYYKQWITGYANQPQEFWGLNIIDFNNGIVTIDHFESDVDLWIDDAGSCITDEEGSLSLLTNGCYIMDQDLQILPGGDTLNGNDEFYRDYCARGFEYPSLQSTYFYPNDSSFGILHSNINTTIAPGVSTTKVFLTSVSESNEVTRQTLIDTIIHSGRIFFHPLNIKGDFILIPLPERNSNTFSVYKMESDSLFLLKRSSLGPIFNFIQEGDFSKVAMSSDGSMMAINNGKYGLILYDLDIETGEISNYRNYTFPIITPSGLCFSPSNQYVYVTNGEHIYQIDITSDPSNPTIYDFGNQYIPGDNGWPIGIGNMMTGPDCRIYIAPGSSTYYMHVIHNPDEYGEAAGLEKHIRVPMRISHNFPNVPNLFASCDSTIRWGITTSVEDLTIDEDNIFVYPNPASQQMTIDLFYTKPDHIVIFNNLGQAIINFKKPTGIYKQNIDVHSWNPGLYFLRSEKTSEIKKLVISK